jgi:23S rRNA-/tRNA-specific pseudouridylate synthase
MRCHNLDFATSGVLMMAKTPEDVAAASCAFDPTRQGPTNVNKEYVAVVVGWPAWDQTTIDAPIEGDPDSPFKMRVPTHHHPASGNDAVVDAGVAARWGPSRLPPAPRWDRDARAGKAREAVTEAAVERRGVLALAGPLRGRKIALVRLHPSTGRRHQLRVHLASQGHPILGDVSYAGDISTHRLCLHAIALTFHHTVGDDPGVFPAHGARVATHEGSATPFDSFFAPE